MTPAIGSLHHVGVVVRDRDRAEAFITSVFGFPSVNRVEFAELGMRAAFLACGKGVIELVEFSDAQVVQQRLGDRVANTDHIALQVSDLEQAAATLAHRGVGMASASPMVLPSGRSHFTMTATSGGIRWQLIEPAGTAISTVEADVQWPCRHSSESTRLGPTATEPVLAGARCIGEQERRGESWCVTQKSDVIQVSVRLEPTTAQYLSEER